MRLRIPIAVVLAPIGLLIGAILVGRPVSVDDDLVLDPALVTVSTTSTSVAPVPTEPVASSAPSTTSTVAPVSDTLTPGTVQP